MPGQAAGKTRSEVTAAMNKLDLSSQKKTGTGSSPVCHANQYGNPEMKYSNGEVFGKTKKIKLQSKITGY